MSDAGAAVRQGTEETRAAVRLRMPERRQMAWVAQCADDLVGPAHSVRAVMAVVETLIS